MYKKIEMRKRGYFSTFLVSPEGITQMLMAVMTRMLKAPEPMIKFDPSSSFWKPLPIIPMMVRNISGADLGPEHKLV